MLRADDCAIRRQAERLGLPVCDAILRALRQGKAAPALLAVCPNSEAVAKAAVLASKEAEAPLLFAATLNQVDRDGGYTGWTQQQFVQLVRGLVEGREYDLVIDHHEDPGAAGFYLYQYARRDASATRGAIDAARALGYPIEQDVRMVILRTRDGLIQAPRWGLWYMRLSRQLTITNYLRLENSRLVYTVETPVHLPWADRLALHRLAFEHLVREP